MHEPVSHENAVTFCCFTALLGVLRLSQVDEEGMVDRAYRLHYNESQRRTDTFAAVSACTQGSDLALNGALTSCTGCLNMPTPTCSDLNRTSSTCTESSSGVYRWSSSAIPSHQARFALIFLAAVFKRPSQHRHCLGHLYGPINSSTITFRNVPTGQNC